MPTFNGLIGAALRASTISIPCLRNFHAGGFVESGSMGTAAEEVRVGFSAGVPLGAVGIWGFADSHHREFQRALPADAKIPDGAFVKVRGNLPEIIASRAPQR